MTKAFAKIAGWIAMKAGQPAAFAGAAALIVLWAVSGPFLHFSETWDLVVNTVTTIVTFLMVFLLQNSQNRERQALQAKIDALIEASEARNKFMRIEKLSDDEIEALRRLEHPCPPGADL